MILPVQIPGTSIIGRPADGHIVPRSTNRDDVAARRIGVVIGGLASAAHDIKDMLKGIGVRIASAAH